MPLPSIGIPLGRNQLIHFHTGPYEPNVYIPKKPNRTCGPRDVCGPQFQFYFAIVSALATMFSVDFKLEYEGQLPESEDDEQAPQAFERAHQVPRWWEFDEKKYPRNPFWVYGWNTDGKWIFEDSKYEFILEEWLDLKKTYRGVRKTDSKISIVPCRNNDNQESDPFCYEFSP